jgi:AAA+ ATPase superfamily predicted ATPase
MISLKEPVSGDYFVNRIALLKNLHSIYPTDNVALIGPRRIGKSSVAKQSLSTLPDKNTIKIIFDVQENIGTPGKFAMRLLRSFMFAYYEVVSKKDAYAIADMEMDPSVLMTVAAELDSKRLQELSRFLVSYYPPTPDNEREVLSRILNFIEDFSVEMGMNTAVVLDEFQCIIDLNKYKGFENGNLLGFLRGIVSKQNRIWYLFTGSAVRIMYNIFGDEDAPFLGRVRLFNISGFNKNDTIELLYKCVEKPISSEAINFLYALTKGHPFYVVVIIGTSERLAANSKMISKKDVENAFIRELSKGLLDIHCRYFFESSLEKTGTFLKEVLRALSDGPLTITELARKVGRVSGSLTDTIKKLKNLDLIVKDRKKYHISDDILICWIKNVYGYDEIRFDVVKKKFGKITKNILQNLPRKPEFTLKVICGKC